MTHGTRPPVRPWTSDGDRVTLARADRRLALLAVSGPVVFTASWWLLGAATPGYDHARDSISAVATTGHPFALPMAAAFVWQGLAQLGNGWLLSRTGHRALAAVLAGSGLGTLAVAALPLPELGGAAWRGPAHTAAATLALGLLHVAAGAGALDTRLPGRVRALGAAALAVALPCTWWFLRAGSTGTGGYAEKLMTTVLLAFTTAVVAAVVGRRTSPGTPRRVP